MAVLCLFCVSALGAQENLVAYVEGTVEFRAQNRWESVEIGDLLPGNAQIRLTEGSYLEVVEGRSTYRFSEAGEYRLATNGQDRGEATETDLRGLLRNKVSRLTSRENDRSSVAVTGGVRASEAAQEPDIDWAGDEDPEELIREGLGLLDEGETLEASYFFEDAYDYATGPSAERAGFYLGYSLYLLEEDEYALEILAELQPDPQAEYYVDYALLGAELLLTDGDSREAEELLRGLISDRPDLSRRDPLSAQAAYFLLGNALRARGVGEAREYYRRSIEVAPGTALALEAERRL